MCRTCRSPLESPENLPLFPVMKKLFYSARMRILHKLVRLLICFESFKFTVQRLESTITSDKNSPSLQCSILHLTSKSCFFSKQCTLVHDETDSDSDPLIVPKLLWPHCQDAGPTNLKSALIEFGTSLFFDLTWLSQKQPSVPANPPSLGGLVFNISCSNFLNSLKVISLPGLYHGLNSLLSRSEPVQSGATSLLHCQSLNW
eukprot:g59052.t1